MHVCFPLRSFPVKNGNSLERFFTYLLCCLFNFTGLCWLLIQCGESVLLLYLFLFQWKFLFNGRYKSVVDMNSKLDCFKISSFCSWVTMSLLRLCQWLISTGKPGWPPLMRFPFPTTRLKPETLRKGSESNSTRSIVMLVLRL